MWFLFREERAEIWPHCKEELKKGLVSLRSPPLFLPFLIVFFFLVQTICPVFLSVHLLFLSPKINCTHIWVHAWHTKRNGRGRGRRNNQEMKTKGGGGVVGGGGWRLVGWGPGSGLFGAFGVVVMCLGACTEQGFGHHSFYLFLFFLFLYSDFPTQIYSLMDFNRCFCNIAAVVSLIYYSFDV